MHLTTLSVIAATIPAVAPFLPRSVRRSRTTTRDLRASFDEMRQGLPEKEEGAEQRQMEAARKIFLDWAEENATPLHEHIHPPDDSDLEAIAEAIGDARVVALSEGYHNCREMMQLHFRLVRYLVEHRGFTTVVTESGLPESRLIHNYVRGVAMPPGLDTEDLYRWGVNKMYGEWQEGRDLIEWMRRYNLNCLSGGRNERDKNDKMLHYYGVDIGGFYEDWTTPLQTQVIDYLNDVDAEYARRISGRLRPFLDVLQTNARLVYTNHMTSRDRAELRILLDEVVDHFNERESDYVGKRGRTEYEWARQSLISMQMAENYYLNCLNLCDIKTSKFVGLNGREIAMHRNILWAMEQRRETGSKVIWINHVLHTKTKTQYQEPPWGFFTPAGQMLRQSLGSDLFIIGMICGGGEYWKHWQQPEVRTIAPILPPEENGLELCLSILGKSMPQYFVPWEKAPIAARPWLQQTSTINENDYVIKIVPAEWNASVYIHRLSPATPASQNPRRPN